jgi:hypothetical protein
MGFVFFRDIKFWVCFTVCLYVYVVTLYFGTAGIQCLSVLRLRVGARSTWAVGLEIGRSLGTVSSWPPRSQLSSKAFYFYSYSLSLAG